MAKPDYLDFLVLNTNPDDFLNWDQQRKLERYQRTMEWHDFAARYNPTKIPYLWGTHQVLSQVRFCSARTMLAAVYRVSSLDEFDRMMDEDPLRDVSRYVTWALSPVEDDKEKDIKRYERLKKQLFGHKDPDKVQEWKELRAQYVGPPDFVGKTEQMTPPMGIKTYFDEPIDKMEILIVGTNPPDYMGWSDAKKLITYEKVLWWADYVSLLIKNKQVSHAWNAHDFCDSVGYAGNSEAAAVVYTVDDFYEFDEVYPLDPLRLSGDFWSVVLQPIAKQREMDEFRLQEAKKRLVR